MERQRERKAKIFIVSALIEESKKTFQLLCIGDEREKEWRKKCKYFASFRYEKKTESHTFN
jgi:hypothetical protein